MHRLAVVGDLVEDVVVWLEGPVEAATDTPARVHRCRGGSAANVAAAAAAHVPVRFAGCVGRDATGERLVAELVAAGVDVHVERRGRTGTVVVLVDPDGERSFLSDRAAAGELRALPPDLLDDVALLHVPAYGLHGGTTAATVRELLEEACSRRVPVSLDASSVAVLRSLGPAPFRRLVEQFRPVVLLANAAEAALLDLLTGPAPETVVVVKDGPRPTTVRTPDGRVLRVPVEPVAGVRDVTGAGDAFAAGWLAAHLQGRPLEDCAEQAHALARGVLTAPGAGALLEEVT